MSAEAMKVVVVGQGYVGLPLSMRAVDVGLNVVGVDLDERRVSALNRGESYVEDVDASQLRAALSSGRYVATSSYDDVEEFDVAVISVPTPLRERAPDLSFIESSATSLAPHVSRGCTVILESTTYPGTTEELVVPLLERGSGLTAGEDFSVGYSPERIDPGNTMWTFVSTPKVVSGVNVASRDAVARFYDQLIDRTVPVSGTREAELTKLLENTFRHVNIALVNELAVFAHQLGVNVWEAIDAAATKPFGFMKFTPGPGVGGHCLPVDPSYLLWEVKRKLGLDFRFVELANDVNGRMPEYVVQRTIVLLNSVSLAINGSRIALIGLAYKKNSGDIREAPSGRIVRLLQEMGADLVAVDPYVSDRYWPAGVDSAPSIEAACENAAAAIVLTEHDDFDWAWLEGWHGQVLDTRNVLTHGAAERL